MAKQMRIYYVNNFFYNLARVLPHAVLSVILLSKGLSFAEISFVQSMYMLGAVVFEFPSGILSDIFSEKKMYLCSVFLIGIAYFMVYVYSGVLLLAVAWLLYGISAAAMSGTLDTWFIKEFKKNNLEIKKFIANNNYSLLFSGLIGGSLGAALYNSIGLNIYVISMSIFTLVFLFVTIGIHTDYNNGSKITTRMRISELITDLQSSLTDKNYLKLLMVLILAYVILQLFFQFWQLVYLDKGIPSAAFALVYPAFQLCSLLSNYLFKTFRFHVTFNYLYIILFAGLFISGVLVANAFLMVVCFFLFFIIFGVYHNQMMYEFQEQSHYKSLSSMTSFLGTMGTLMSMITLWLISFALQSFALEYILATLMLILSVLSLYTYKMMDHH